MGTMARKKSPPSTAHGNTPLLDVSVPAAERLGATVHGFIESSDFEKNETRHWPLLHAPSRPTTKGVDVASKHDAAQAHVPPDSTACAWQRTHEFSHFSPTNQDCACKFDARVRCRRRCQALLVRSFSRLGQRYSKRSSPYRLMRIAHLSSDPLKSLIVQAPSTRIDPRLTTTLSPELRVGFQACPSLKVPVCTAL